MLESNDVTPVSKKSRKGQGKKMLPWLLLIFVLVAGLAGTMYYKDRAEKVEADPTTVQKEKNQAETDRVLTSLKRAILITETDAPTVARVEDPEKLKSSNATFYKDVQVGDYLIIYPKRAIVYRENIDQIINIAPIINTADLKSTDGTTPASTTTNTTPATAQ
ncbi:MAG TPA: hypothetical protein PKD20_02935 [Candidatus Saccharibacteria bacterium]|jgi:hypothetical protein|nr:hypothetical protein [Candidatus Saccharibacteria bacterium]